MSASLMGIPAGAPQPTDITSMGKFVLSSFQIRTTLAVNLTCLSMPPICN